MRVISLLLTVPAIFRGARLGTDFMPELDEGALLLQTVLMPHTISDVLVVRAIRIGLVGERFSEVFRGQRRFDLTVRLQEDRRGDVAALGPC